MKQRFFISLFALVCSLPLLAKDTEKAPYAWPWNQGLTWHAGVDAVSSYLLRGWNYGGMALEPHASIGYAGAEIAAWANIGSQDWSFQNFDPQLNITISYTIAGLKIGITHLHYFNSKYFDFSGKTYEEYTNGTGNWNQTEVFAVYQGPDKFPLRLSWYTYVLGNDVFPDTDTPPQAVPPVSGSTQTTPIVEPNMYRAFSTYIEVAYRFNLPLGFSLTPAIGISPWKGYYTRNEGNFAVKNLELRAERPFDLFNHIRLNVWAVGMLDCYRINTQNFITTIDDSWSKQRLNFAIGAGISIF